MKNIFFCVVILYSSFIFSQEKKLWAKSFINNKAPEFNIEKWISEKSDTKGKFILLEFWATWCGACRNTIPVLNKFHNKFMNDLVIIGISSESESVLRKFKKPQIDYYSAIDTRKILLREYEVKGIPHCVIINPKGIVVWEGYPQQKGFELTSEIISQLIKNK